MKRSLRQLEKVGLNLIHKGFAVILQSKSNHITQKGIAIMSKTSIPCGCGEKKEEKTQMSIPSGNVCQGLTTGSIEGDWEVKCVLGDGSTIEGEIRIGKEGKLTSERSILFLPNGSLVDATGALELVDPATGLFRGEVITTDGATTLISVRIDSTNHEMTGSFQNEAAPGAGKIYLTRISE